MKNAKRNIVIVTMLLFVCAAVYLNWSYNNKWGDADSAMVKAEDDAMAAAKDKENDSTVVSDYFAGARLTRQTSRDEALALLQTAAGSDGVSQETIDLAMNSITAMATWSMQETQVENMLIAKDFADCVVYMSNSGVTVAVPAPSEGLSAAAVARITEIITSETEYDATQINVIEIRDGVPVEDAAATGDDVPGDDTVTTGEDVPADDVIDAA